MKKFLGALSVILLFNGVAGFAVATPVYFDLGGSDDGSSVTVLESAEWSNLTASLDSDLDAQTFWLQNGETKEVNFFSLTTDGIGGGQYTINATLAFEAPFNHSAGSGNGYFFTLWGVLSGGTLIWDPLTIPDYFAVNGNTISVDFEDGCVVGLGNTVMIHAYVTNEGDGSVSPIPEPATMLLFGVGLIGVAALGRNKFLTH